MSYVIRTLGILLDADHSSKCIIFCIKYEIFSNRNNLEVTDDTSKQTEIIIITCDIFFEKQKPKKNIALLKDCE